MNNMRANRHYDLTKEKLTRIYENGYSISVIQSLYGIGNKKLKNLMRSYGIKSKKVGYRFRKQP